MTTDLYNPEDVKKAREILKKQQSNLCAITRLELSRGVMDHSHDDQQLCRGVIESTMNVFVGVIERGYLRYIRHWCKIPLPDLLRMVADYLENSKHKDDYRHPKWTKKVTTEFNKLTSAQRTVVLAAFTDELGKNDAERKKIFKKLLTKKAGIGFVRIMGAIQDVK